MKSRAPLVMMEQLVMVLVFALAAAVCVRIFALSDRLSLENETRDRAVTAVQNAAETLKACRGNYGERLRRGRFRYWRSRRTADRSCWAPRK